MKIAIANYYALLVILVNLMCTNAQAKSVYCLDSVITVSQGTNFAISLSPDEKTMAMDLQGLIWTLNTEGGSATPITDVFGDCRQPVWSPDGQYIAFQSYRDGYYHIWRVRKDGTDLQQLTAGIYHDREPYWSPDGQFIYFSSDRNGSYDIWKLDLSDGDLNQITDSPADAYYPCISKTGQLLYISKSDTAYCIFSKNQSGHEKQLVQGKNILVAPAWNPDETGLTYIELGQEQAKLNMYSVHDSSSVILSTDEDVFPFRTSWLKEGKLMYTADGLVKVLGLEKKATEVIPFFANLSVNQSAVKMKKRNFDTSIVKRVLGVRNPSLSPDGKEVVFTALGDLYVLKEGQNLPENITHSPSQAVELDPSWSTDGKSIVYTQHVDGQHEIWTVNRVDGRKKKIWESTELLKFPAFSPSDKQLVFLEANSIRSNQYHLSVLDLHTGAKYASPQTFFEPSQPSWLNSEAGLVFSAQVPYSKRFREGTNQMTVVSLPEFNIKHYPLANGQSLATRGKNGPLVSPSGKNVAFVSKNLLYKFSIDRSGQPTEPPIRLSNEIAEAISWGKDDNELLFIAADQLKKLHVEEGQLTSILLDLSYRDSTAVEPYLIHAGRVFNGKDSVYQHDMDILVKGNRILSIAPHQSVGHKEYKVIDAHAYTLVPGLFEMHTHQNAYLGDQMGKLWLSYGVTTLREPGTDPYDALERKESWESGARVGPRTFFTGGHMEGHRVYYNRNTSNVGGVQLQLELDRAVKLGYDMIKTYVGLSDELQQQVTKFAHQHGLPVASHEIYPAAVVGVDAVEHIGATSRRGYSPKLSYLNKSYEDVIKLLCSSGMYITPTISLHGGMRNLIKTNPSFFNHPQFRRFYGDDVARRLKASTRVDNTYPNIESTIRKLDAGHAKMTLGTDSPIIPPGLSYHAELQSWVAAGISPFKVLRAATWDSAVEIGVENELGTIEAGKLADFILVDGDPLLHIEDLLNVNSVIKNGVFYKNIDLLN